MSNNILLSILIPTIVGREQPFQKLYDKLYAQIRDNHLLDSIEIVSECDDRKMSIGSKRQLLIEKAQGRFIVFIDDDDDVAVDYCFAIAKVIRENEGIDAIGFLQQCTFDGGTPVMASLSNRWSDWAENVGGYRYVRTPFFPTPMLRDYALQVGYRDMRYAEDHDFARRLKASRLIQNEYFMNSIMYYYIYTYGTPQEKYGVTL